MFPQAPIERGRRIAIFGRTGSGKTYLSKWIILRASKIRWAILDTKFDPSFDGWHPHNGLPSMREIERWWRKEPRIVIRPAPEENYPAVLDAWVGQLHDGFENFGLLIDETYQVALGTRPGPGLTGLVTRGRARGQTAIMGSQRPAWLPRFVFSEADDFIILRLTLLEDRQRVASMVSDDCAARVMLPLKPRRWLHYGVTSDTLAEYAPVLIKQKTLDIAARPPVEKDQTTLRARDRSD